MNKIQAVTVWWYAHIPKRTEVNFYRRKDKIGNYQRVTPSSRERLGNVLDFIKPHVTIGDVYTAMYYTIEEN